MGLAEGMAKLADKDAVGAIRLRDTYYHYCEIDSETVTTLLDALSIGMFYKASIKNSGRWMISGHHTRVRRVVVGRSISRLRVLRRSTRARLRHRFKSIPA